MKKLMNIFKVSPKKKKILRVNVKDKSCNSPEGLQLYQKEAPNWVFSREYSKSFRNSFFIEQLWWLLLNYVLVSEKNFKKES